MLVFAAIFTINDNFIAQSQFVLENIQNQIPCWILNGLIMVNKPMLTHQVIAFVCYHVSVWNVQNVPIEKLKLEKFCVDAFLLTKTGYFEMHNFHLQ